MSDICNYLFCHENLTKYLPNNSLAIETISFLVIILDVSQSPESQIRDRYSLAHYFGGEGLDTSRINHFSSSIPDNKNSCFFHNRPF